MERMVMSEAGMETIVGNTASAVQTFAAKTFTATFATMALAMKRRVSELSRRMSGARP